MNLEEDLFEQYLTAFRARDKNRQRLLLLTDRYDGQTWG